MGGILTTKNKNKLGKKFFKLGAFLAFVLAKFLEGFYSVHVRIRLLHDKAYQHGGIYKKWSDKPYSRTVHKAAVLSFVISFIFFNVLSSLFPYIFNPAKPQVAKAGSNTVTWDTSAQFQSGTTVTDLDLVTVQDNVRLGPSDLFGNGLDGSHTVNTDFNLNSMSRSTRNGSYADGFMTTSSNSEVAGSAVVIEVISGAGFVAGDDVFISKFWKASSTSTGINEIAKVTSVSGNSITVQSLTNSYPAGSLVQRVPQFDALTINAGVTVTADAWNGSTGGVVIFKAKNLTNNGSIQANALGYINGGPNQGGAGHYFSDYCTANDGGGGGGFGAAGGKGGGHMGSTTGGAGGSANVSSLLEFGSSGGVSHSSLANSTGRGGGIVFISAGSLSNSGTISSSGGAGGSYGGGGAGGAVKLQVGQEIQSVGNVIANGGAGGDYGSIDPECGNGGASGGGGGGGKILIEIPGSQPGGTITRTGGSAGPTYTGDTPAVSGSANNENWKGQIAAYKTLGKVSGFLISLDDGKARWNSLNWNYNSSYPLPSGASVLFRARTKESSLAEWSAWTEFSQNAAGSLSGSGDLGVLPASQFLELELNLAGDGFDTPTIDSFSVTYGSLLAPTDVGQYRTDTGVKIANDTYTNETSVILKASIQPMLDSSTLVPEIELVFYDTDPGTPTFTGNKTTTGFTATNITLDASACGGDDGLGNCANTLTGQDIGVFSGLVADKVYFYKVRFEDALGRVSAWSVSYGKFLVEQTAPTGTVLIDNNSDGANDTYVTTQNVTLKISATDTGGSGLSQMRISNDGTFDAAEEDWQNYATSLPWTLLSGNDGQRKVYVQFRDNAGNTSGRVTDTTLADFNGGTKNYIAVLENGSLKIDNSSVVATIRPMAPGNYTQFTPYPPEFQNWQNVDEEVHNSGDYNMAGSVSTTFRDFYSLSDLNIGGSSVTSVKININYTAFADGNGDDNPTGTPAIKFGLNDGVGDWFGNSFAPSNTNFNSLILNTNPRTNSNWTTTEINNLQAGVEAINDSDSTGWLTQLYVEVTYTPSNNSGVFTSKTFDNSETQNYGKILWGADVPSQTGVDALRFQVASNNDNATWNFLGPDGTVNTYYTNSGTNLWNGHNDNRYLRYKAYLQTSDTNYSPIVYDVAIEVNTTTYDTVTLDTQPPTAFTLASPANNAWSNTEASPTFTWNASSGHNKYELWIDGVKSGGDIAAGTTTATPAAPLTEGNHTWQIKAYDEANNVTSSAIWNYGYDVTVPGQPSTFSAVGGTETIEVNWSYNNSGSPITSYYLERIDWINYDPANPGADWSGYGSYSFKEYTGATATLAIANKVDFELIAQGQKYAFRIRAKDTANNEYGETSNVISGLTEDTSFSPGYVQNVAVSPCNGVNNCSTKADIPHKGYENKITWSAAVDGGVGTSHYLVYRSTTGLNGTNYNNAEVRNSYKIVGVLPYFVGQSPTWYDNDANNQAISTFYDVSGDVITISSEIQALTRKTTASNLLNDYVKYYYRVMAVDANNNKTNLFPEAPTAESDYDVLRAAQNGNAGTDAERTPDVTPPSIPANLTTTPTGVDSLGGEPLTQAVDVAWSPAVDTRTAGRVPTGSGIGNITYKLYQATGNANGPTGSYLLVYTGATAARTIEGLSEDSYYYFKVVAIDGAVNPAEANYGSYYSEEERALTKNSQVPTTPTGVTVTAKTGDPNTDPEVGYKLTISFTGSRIVGTGNRVDGYRVYRRTANSSVRTEWTSTTPVCNFENLNIPAETQDGNRQCNDTVQNDATDYFYKVEAYGWNDSNQTVEVSPSLSAIQPSSPHLGWDTTPDATAPAQPANVTVKDIHGNTSMVRNIVTWQMIAEPQRQGVTDFLKYQVYRYETNLGIGTATLIAEKVSLGDNYHVDGISLAEKNKSYSYYVVSLDDAQTNFRYANGNIINPQTNISTHEAAVSINPGESKPTVSNVAHSNIGVSTATITWITNQEADSLVEYRVKDSATVVASGKDRTSPVTSHVVNLTNLQKGSTYQYRIVSRNSVGNIDDVAAITWHEFNTEDFSITGANVVTTTTTAKVIWNTPITSDSSVEYKREATAQAEDSATAGDPALVTAHEVVIKALQPDTNYTYKIRSVTGDKYIAETNFLTFRTKPFDASQFVIAPNASNIAEQNITATSAKIVWNTAIATTTWVDYGIESTSYNQSTGNNTFNTVHVVELLNLVPGRTYYYRVRGKDSNSIEYTSKEYTFTAVLKPSFEGLKVDVDSPYTTIVTFATNVATEAVVTYGKSGSFDLKAGTTEYKRNHTILLKDLEDGAGYNLYAEIKDKLGNVEKSQTFNIVTKIDTAGPRVSNMNVELLPIGDSDDTASAIISWATDKPTTTKLEYDEGAIGGKYSKSTIEDNSLSTTHTVIIKELSPGSTYHFRIASKNKRGTLAYSQDFTFVTPVKEKSILQLIIRSLEETFSWVRNVGQFFRGVGQKAK